MTITLENPRNASKHEHLAPEGFSQDSNILSKEFRQFNGDYLFPISRYKESIIRKFYTLASTWRSDVLFTSSTSKMVMHPAYQQIIGMGRDVVPLLLLELEERPDHWFWALEAITGVDPIKPEHHGKIKEMAAAWLKWGKENGYKW